MKKFAHVLSGVLLVLALASCATVTPAPAPKFVIDDATYHARGQNERIQFIVLHYTAENDADSLDILTNGNVSAHYLIPKNDGDKIYQLVPDDKRAWHAGNGSFAGRSVLNDTAIGIEIVNDGIAKEFRGEKGYHPAAHFVEFDELQIQKVAFLVKNLAEKYRINPTQIIAHSDLAPQRKIDPGAKFPWQRLYFDYQIGAWYDAADKAAFMDFALFSQTPIPEIKALLRGYGYAINDTPDWDKASQNVVYAFQLHFRPHQPTGIMDLETFAILKALDKKYNNER